MCNKAKDLRGPHLNGKKVVRSDCWPCAKKQTFHLIVDAPAAAVGGTFSSPPQFLFSQQQAPTSAASAPAPQKSPFVSAFKATAPSTAAAPISNPFSSFGGGKTGNPFTTAAAPPTAITTATAQQHIVMQNNAPTPGKGKPMPSPPFSFVGKSAMPPVISLTPASTELAAATSAGAATTLTMTPDDQWKCATCQKNKDLRGKHLDGKESVRSDCWPCATKRTFLRYSPSGVLVRKSVVPVESKAASTSPSTLHIPSGNTSTRSQPSFSTKSNQTPQEPVSTTDTIKTSSSFDATPVAPYHAKRSSAFQWREPEVPSHDAERQFFVQSVAAAGAPSSSNNCGEISLSTMFYEKTIHAYLAHIRANAFTRNLPMVWEPSQSVVFVTCGFFLSKVATVSPTAAPPSTLCAVLGDVSSVLMHLDTTIGVANSERIGRVFCPDSITLAAAALYQLHINGDIVVFGPAADKTTKPTLLDEIIDIHPTVQTRVTSGDQRNAASKKLWQSQSISAMPNAVLGEAIRQCEPLKPKSGTVDVVLIAKNTSADEASQFRLLIA